jgi:capsular polysaccharide transport system permease protein
MSSTYIQTKQIASNAMKVVKALAALYFVGVFIVIAYVWLFTADRYISQATFKISRQDTSAAGESGLLQLAMPGMSDSGSVDSQVAIGYINSADLLLDLEKQFDLLKHYNSPKQDIIFRLEADAPLEERLKYYRKRISAHFDKETGLTVINVDTFEPALSHQIATVVLERSEAFVNLINQQIADQQLTFIRSEVDRTSERVNQIHREQLEFQNKHKFISPSEVIGTSIAAVQEMQMERLRTDAELSSLLRDSPGSPMIENLKSRLISLKELIDGETAKLSGTERDRLNQILVEFQEIGLRLETATRLRTGAEMLLEKNRTDAVARSKFFSVIQSPYLPEDVAYPRRFYSSITILVLGLLCFVILRALVNSVFDRA